MALKVKELKRVFYNEKEKIELPDPDPNMHPDKVLLYYSNQYPELVNSSVAGPEVLSDKLKFKFVTGVGTKG